MTTQVQHSNSKSTNLKKSSKVAVITGAASGIGLALAKACAERNMHVVMIDRVQDALAKEASVLRQYSHSGVLDLICDVTQIEEVQAAAKQTIQQFGRIDWLINNAGISGRLAPLWELSSQEVRQVLDVNLHGTIHGIQAFLPFLFAQNHRSRIVNMASVYGLCSGSQMAAYAMSKHAVVALSESLFFDLKRLNKPIDVSVVCPSFVSTSLLTNASNESSDTLHQMMCDLIERARPAEDVAKYILQELEKNIFYILPDREVKDYCEERSKAILQQACPHSHGLEKLLHSLSKRAVKA